MARASAVPALLLLALLAAAIASAQAPAAPAVRVALEARALQLDAGEAATLEGTVSNDGPLAGTVALALALPPGWSGTVEPAELPVAAGGSERVVVRLQAPEAGVGAASAELALEAVLTDALGRAASSSATVALGRLDPPPPPPADARPLVAASLLGLLLLAAAAAALAWRRRRAAALAAYWDREKGIQLDVVDGPRSYGGRRELVSRVALQNVSARPRVATVRVAECAPRWRASVSLPRAPLSPGERIEVAVHIAPDADVPAGEAGRIVVAARPEEAQDFEERVTIAPQAPGARPQAPAPP